MSGVKTVKYGRGEAKITPIKTKGTYRVTYRDIAGKLIVAGEYKDFSKAEKKAIQIAKQIKYNWNPDDVRADTSYLLTLINEGNLTADDISALAKQKKKLVSKLTGEAAAKYIKEKSQQGNTTKYTRDVKRQIRYLCELHATVPMHQLNKSHYMSVLDSKPTWSLRSREKFVNDMKSFEKWALDQGYISERHSIKIMLPKKHKSKPHKVFTPEEFSKLLLNCKNEFIPWLVLAGFAGLRASEIMGSENNKTERSRALRWGDVYLDRKIPVIYVRPETSKTDRARIVKLHPTLVKWLKPYYDNADRDSIHGEERRGELIYPIGKPTAHTGDMPETQRLAKIIGKKFDNQLRKSSSSYLLSSTGDDESTAKQHGHSIGTMKSQYINPRFEEDSEEWYSLTPEKVGRKNLG